MAKSKAKDTKKNTADVGFEDQLWNAADVLRGNLDAAEYKNVVLGLIFLKYLSDRFDERYLELVAEGYGDEEDRDCYMEQNVFFVPEEARWANISQARIRPKLADHRQCHARHRARERQAQRRAAQELRSSRTRQEALGRRR